jgi:RNA polymerase sigma-70 factor, ECF subfamily
MDSALAALTSVYGPSGDTRVDNAELTTRLQALHPQCVGWAKVCCAGRTEDAEDVLQDVYLGVLGDGLRFDGRSTFKTWIFGVIRQKARGRMRRERLRELLGLTNATRIDTPQPAALPDDDAVASDRRARTRTALGALPHRQREVLLLVFYHDLTVDDAAKVMGVSVGSARVHYDRGKKRMAALLPHERREPVGTAP